MNGRVPQELVAVVCGSRGYVLDKGGGEPRAVSCTWGFRRVAGKVELAQNGQVYAEDLGDSAQYGVGIPGGVNFVYHANMLGLHAAREQAGVTEAQLAEPSYSSQSEKQPVNLQTDFSNYLGHGIINFDKVPFVIESSGAWGKSARELWHMLKQKAKAIKLQNYVRANKPRTWTAFTFSSFYSQAISFAVAKHTAQAVIRGLQSARC